MGKFQEAVRFLKTDIDKVKSQYEDGKRIVVESFLQRNGKGLDDLVDMFDPSDNESKWCEEYKDKKREPKLRMHSLRMGFLQACRKEFHEEYDTEITDCDFMRLMEVPHTDAKYVIDVMSLSGSGD